MTTPPMPTRLRILHALTEALEQITPANGYVNDLTGSVFRGRIWFGDNDPLPMVAILQPPTMPDIRTTPGRSTIAEYAFDISIQGFVEDDGVLHPTDAAEVLLADVKQCLVRERKRSTDYDILGLGPLITEMTIGGGVCRPSDEVSAKSYFWLTVALQIVEDLEEPYA